MKLNSKALVALTSISALFSVSADDTIIITATRLEEIQAEVTGATEQIDADTLQERQQFRLQDALNAVSGVTSTSVAGQEGQTGSLFIRGLKAQYNQVLLDGVRISDSVASSGSYGNVLGNFAFAGNENVEVAKGAHGVVHGSGAIGGVVGVYTPFTEDSPSLKLTQEIGSYEARRSVVSATGYQDGFSYYVEGLDSYFEQDLPVNQAQQVSTKQFSTGLEREIVEGVRVNVTTRTQSVDIADPQADIANDLTLSSVKLLANFDEYTGALVYGNYMESYNYGGSYFTELTKESVTLDNTFNLSEKASVYGGADLAWSSYLSGTKLDSWETYAGYLGVKGELGQLSYDLGGRLEKQGEFDLFPSSHAQIGYEVESLGLSSYLRATSAYRAPSFLEANAFPAIFFWETPQIANPDLQEERVESVELGFTQSLGDYWSLAMNGYVHEVEDAISVESTGTAFGSPNQARNTDGNSFVKGAEFQLKGELTKQIRLNVAWGYLYKNDIVSLPRNTVSADVVYDHGRYTVGIGATHRTKASFGQTNGRQLDSNVITRLYANTELSSGWSVHTRVENLFNEQYEVNPFAYDYSTFPAPAFQQTGRGTAFFLGLSKEW